MDMKDALSVLVLLTSRFHKKEGTFSDSAETNLHLKYLRHRVAFSFPKNAGRFSFLLVCWWARNIIVSFSETIVTAALSG